MPAASLLLCAEDGTNTAQALARIDDPDMVAAAIDYALGEARRKVQSAVPGPMRRIYEHSADNLQRQVIELKRHKCSHAAM